jgi:hypothetical protein
VIGGDIYAAVTPDNVTATVARLAPIVPRNATWTARPWRGRI